MITKNVIFSEAFFINEHNHSHFDFPQTMQGSTSDAVSLICSKMANIALCESDRDLSLVHTIRKARLRNKSKLPSRQKVNHYHREEAIRPRLENLPAEILLAIASECSRHDCLNLCVTSRYVVPVN